MKLLLLGPPASGKGTVGKMLAEKLGIPLLSVGNLLRDLPEDFDGYEEIEDIMERGDLVSSEIVAKLIKNEIKKAKYKKGYILDGWMRRLEEKKHFEPGYDFVIFFRVSEDTVTKRITGRRFCPADDFSCNIYTLPPESPNSCNKCSGELVKREDDNLETVENRLRIYKKDTVPSINYYKKQGNLIEINGEPIPEIVLGEVLEKLKTNYDFN